MVLRLLDRPWRLGATVTFLYTFKGQDLQVPIHLEHESAVAICPICGLSVLEVAYIQEHLDWHALRLGS